MGNQNELQTLVIIFISYLTYYYNRKCVTLIFPQLIKEGLSQQNAGTIISCQSISTAFVTFAAGILSDKISSKFLVSFGLILCGISTLLFPFGTTVTQYSILWFINGIGQGFSLPSILKVTKDNSHPTRFATNWSIVLISINVSGVINPLLSAYITKTYSWRTSIFISAFMTLSVGLISYLLLSEPIDEQKLNKKNGIKKSQPEVKTIDVLKFPILWMCIICRFITAVSRLSTADWSQIYLINEKDIDIYAASSLVSVVEIGGIFGKLIAGRISDILLKRSLEKNPNLPPIMTRIPVSIAMMFINALAIHVLCFVVNKESSVLLLTTCGLLLGITTAGNIVTITVMATEVGSTKFAGLCSSLTNLSAKVGGILTGLPLTLIANYYSWNFTFILIELLCILGVILQIVIPKMSRKLKIE